MDRGPTRLPCPLPSGSVTESASTYTERQRGTRELLLRWENAIAIVSVDDRMVGKATYRSTFSSISGLLGLDLLTWIKLSRKLTGMRDVPGILTTGEIYIYIYLGFLICFRCASS